MQTGAADVVAVAKAAAQFRAAIFCAGVVIRAFHHVHTPYAVASLQLFWGKACRRAENTLRGFDENAGDEPVHPRNTQQGDKLFVARSRQPLYIAMNGLQRLLLGHNRLERLVCRDARKDLSFEVVQLFFACIHIFCQQSVQTGIESGVQLLGLRRKALCRSLPKITGKIGFLHCSAFVPAFTKPFFLYPQSQYGPPEARVYCRTKFVAAPASLMV